MRIGISGKFFICPQLLLTLKKSRLTPTPSSSVIRDLLSSANENQDTLDKICVDIGEHQFANISKFLHCQAGTLSSSNGSKDMRNCHRFIIVSATSKAEILR